MNPKFPNVLVKFDNRGKAAFLFTHKRKSKTTGKMLEFNLNGYCYIEPWEIVQTNDGKLGDVREDISIYRFEDSWKEVVQIEAKYTSKDLEDALNHHRLEGQAQDLEEHLCKKIIMAVVLNMILVYRLVNNIGFEYEIPVLLCKNFDSFMEKLRTMVRRISAGEWKAHAPILVTTDRKGPIQSLTALCPGITGKIAARLLLKFGSVVEVLSLSWAEMVKALREVGCPTPEGTAYELYDRANNLMVNQKRIYKLAEVEHHF